MKRESIIWLSVAILVTSFLIVNLRANRPHFYVGDDENDQAIQKWVKVLSDHIADDNTIIQESAWQALIVIGEPALPVLKKLASGRDTPTKEAARKLIYHIEAGELGPRPQASPKTSTGDAGSLTKRLLSTPFPARF
jgi:hypothetical protein